MGLNYECHIPNSLILLHISSSFTKSFVHHKQTRQRFEGHHFIVLYHSRRLLTSLPSLPLSAAWLEMLIIQVMTSCRGSEKGEGYIRFSEKLACLSFYPA